MPTVLQNTNMEKHGSSLSDIEKMKNATFTDDDNTDKHQNAVSGKNVIFFNKDNEDEPELKQVNEKKKKNRNKSYLGPDFVAPDGGWGWFVALAAGCSNLSTFVVLQQFGLLFRGHLAVLGITNSQITTLINMNSALTSIVGLANGPMFRRFTFRQVSFCGGCLVVIALFLISLAESFLAYLLTFSVLYGAGVGIAASANSLALNTYFKEKRRIATGLSWTATALGPIIMPHIITLLMKHFDSKATVMMFSGFALVAVACSLVFQPVQWHVKKQNCIVETCESEVCPFEPEIECKYCQSFKRKPQTFFSSQYLYNADDTETPGYEIIDPGTPMLSRANDGWYSESNKKAFYGSKKSLTSNKHSYASIACDYRGLPPEKNSLIQEVFRKRSNTFNLENEVLKDASRKLENYVNQRERPMYCTCLEDRRAALLEREQQNTNIDDDLESQTDTSNISFFRKIFIFFDLDLLRDLSYVNLMVGVTIANFAELNFSVLTPFVLGDMGFANSQIAVIMSLLGGMDISVRFLIPFIAGKIGWENKTFFLFGVLGMALGRIILASFRSYNVVIMIGCWIGLNKGLRTVFMALVIPSYIPLDRLPAATGLQLMFSGIFYLVMGPVVGLIRDATTTAITLHSLNILTYITAISWGLEKFYRSRKAKQEQQQQQKLAREIVLRKLAMHNAALRNLQSK